MKKISRKDLNGIKQTFPVLTEKEMRHFVGGYSDGYSGDGWGDDWINNGFYFTDPSGNTHWYSGFSKDEFYSWDGPWYGGWVEGMGYVLPEVTIYGSYGDNGNNDWGYGLPEVTIYGNYTGGENGFSIGSATSYLTGYAANSSTGYCARAVRSALEAGGISTSGRPNSACDYDTYLQTIGFSTVNKNNYTPQAGDIVVHEATSGHQHGHIAMYNGQQWVSDFVQSDMYGGSAYRSANNYTILRWNH